MDGVFCYVILYVKIEVFMRVWYNYTTLNVRILGVLSIYIYKIITTLHNDKINVI